MESRLAAELMTDVLRFVVADGRPSYTRSSLDAAHLDPSRGAACSVSAAVGLVERRDKPPGPTFDVYYPNEAERPILLVTQVTCSCEQQISCEWLWDGSGFDALTRLAGEVRVQL